jgi:hypothetical protein
MPKTAALSSELGKSMAMSGSTWRKHPLVVGCRYLSVNDSPDFTNGNISIGKEYLLNHIGHSHYDGASVFTFECVSTKEVVSWWWFDFASDSLCEDNFKLIT